MVLHSAQYGYICFFLILKIRHSFFSSLSVLVLSLLFVGMIGTSFASASDKPFDMSANWGGTGLMEIPTARILPDASMRLGLAQADPYVWYAFGFGAFPGLEFSARYTDVTSIASGLGSEYDSYKDKAFDVKYQLFPESRRWPAVAVGLNDFQGTRLFESQYVVLSRQIYPLDLTLGIGRERLKGPICIGEEIGFWGGVEWAASERLHLILEYNPIEYEKDNLPARGVPRGGDSPFNVGLRYRTWLGFDLGLSYQRGDIFGLAAHLQFGLGRPILPPKPDPPSWAFAADPAVEREQMDLKLKRLAADIEKAGFTDIDTSLADGELIAEFENDRYFSDAKAAGRTLRLLLHAVNGTQRLSVIMKRRGVKILKVSVLSGDIRNYLMGNMSLDHFSSRLSITALAPADGPPIAAGRDIAAALRYHGARQALTYGVAPSVESFFNDPSGVYQSRLSLKPYATFAPWPGGALHASYDLPLVSDVGSETTPPSDAVRSDAWKYLGNHPVLNQLLVDQIVKLAPLTYARFSAGYLERMYAGAGAELLTYLDRGRWGLGLEGDWVRKRQPDETFAFAEQQNHILLGNVYYRYLPLGITLKTQVGRFLAGDTGVRMEYCRRFDTGAEIGFWYSMTDTGHLTGFNRDYSDQGIFLKLPFATFTDYPTRRMLEYRISPWTRDVGATIDHWQDLYDVTGELTPLYFGNTLDRINE